MNAYNAYLDVTVYRGMFPTEATVEIETEAGTDTIWVARSLLANGRLPVFLEEKGYEYSTVWLPGPAMAGGHVVRVPTEHVSEY